MEAPEGWSELSPYKWKQVEPGSRGEKKTLFGLCRACMQGDCATLVHMEDGVVVKVEGRPGAPPNWGTLCPKGNSEIMALYNPYRVKAPMIRTNPEKGLDVDPRWREVTWDEALDYTAERLKEVRAKDPSGLIVCEGWGQRDTILRRLLATPSAPRMKPAPTGRGARSIFPPVGSRGLSGGHRRPGALPVPHYHGPVPGRISGLSRACAGSRGRLQEE